MNQRIFFAQLSSITLVIALIIIALQIELPPQSIDVFIWMSLALFVGLSIIMYMLGYRAATGRNKYAFVNLALVMTLVKMLLCVAIVLIYKESAPIPSRLFLGLFLGIYLVYTIFETYFMMKLGNMKSL